jgi:3-oxoacyl-[acyl-carrier protein] reductase
MKVAILTGASSGIGYEVARELAEEGYTLILGSRQPEEAVRKLQKLGATVVGVAGDLAEEHTAKQLIAEATRLGQLDALFLNHGGPPIKPVLDVTDEEWEKYFRLMVMGPLRLFRLAVPLFQKNNGGRVVAITSYTVKSPYPGIVLSNSLRAALANALKTAALELGKENILINMVAPGYILTDRIREWNESFAAQEGVTPEEIARRSTEGIPLGRYGKPEEIAEMISFLLTKNKYVSGQQILVDGGLVVAN